MVTFNFSHIMTKLETTLCVLKIMLQILKRHLCIFKDIVLLVNKYRMTPKSSIVTAYGSPMAYLNYTAQDFASSLENRRPLCSFQVEFSSSIKWRIMWSLYHRYLRNVDLGTIIFHEFCFIFSVFFFSRFQEVKVEHD